MKRAKINNLVIFDFCETLCKYQTANDFVDFASHNTNMSFLNKLLSFLSSNRLLISLIWLVAPRFNFSKRTKLFSLKGCSESVLLDHGRSYFDKCKYDLHDIVVEKLKHHVSIGDHVIIVSGGYEIYLSYFKNYFGISAVLGTKIKFKNEMKSFVEHKIEEIYNVAIKLGVENATDMEKDLFKKALRQIAVAAIDEVRGNISQLLHEESNKYTNGNGQ